MHRIRSPALKTVLVTGASGGIGRAICSAFSNAGYGIIGVDRRSDPDFPWDMVEFDLRMICSPCGERESFFRDIDNLADGRLGVLVNNAAIQVSKPLDEFTPENLAETMETNLIAPFLLIQHSLTQLKKNSGCVINMASIHAQITKPGFSVYSASKGGLVSMTKALAVELAPEVRLNTVLPAATDTPMLREGFAGSMNVETLGDFHPMKRIAAAREVAEVVLFLASPAAGFMTGAEIRVDGGIGALLHDPSASV